jgi:hypothetical protein
MVKLLSLMNKLKLDKCMIYSLIANSLCKTLFRPQ